MSRESQQAQVREFHQSWPLGTPWNYEDMLGSTGLSTISEVKRRDREVRNGDKTHKGLITEGWTFEMDSRGLAHVTTSKGGHDQL